MGDDSDNAIDLMGATLGDKDSLGALVMANYPGVMPNATPQMPHTGNRDALGERPFLNVECDAPCNPEKAVTRSSNAALMQWESWIRKARLINHNKIDPVTSARLLLPEKVGGTCYRVYDNEEALSIFGKRQTTNCARYYEEVENDNITSLNDVVKQVCPAYGKIQYVHMDDSGQFKWVSPDDGFADADDLAAEDVAAHDLIMKTMKKVMSTVSILHDKVLYINNLSLDSVYVDEDDNVYIGTLTELSPIPQLMFEEACLMAFYCANTGDYDILDKLYHASPVKNNAGMLPTEFYPGAHAVLEPSLSLESQSGGGKYAFYNMLALSCIIVVMAVFGS